MSLQIPQRNKALGTYLQMRLNGMYAGRNVGMSGREIVNNFSRYSTDIEPYRRDGDWSIPVRWQIFEDCLARFTLPEQKRIIQDLMDYTGFSTYAPPKQNDIATVRQWLWQEDLAGQLIRGVEGASNILDITLGNGCKLRIQFVNSPRIEYPEAT
jgi:hypothetical protein